MVLPAFPRHIQWKIKSKSFANRSNWWDSVTDIPMWMAWLLCATGHTHFAWIYPLSFSRSFSTIWIRLWNGQRYSTVFFAFRAFCSSSQWLSVGWNRGKEFRIRSSHCLHEAHSLYYAFFEYHQYFIGGCVCICIPFRMKRTAHISELIFKLLSHPYRYLGGMEC